MATGSRLRTFFLRAITLVLLAAIVLGIAFGVRAMSNQATEETENGNSDGGGANRQAVPVQSFTVERRDLRETVRGIGTLRAWRTVHLAPEIDGPLIAVHFEEGEVVSEGDLLFELDDRKLRQRLQSQQSSLRAARARLDIARSTFERVERLREQNVASTDEYDRARTDLDAALADVDHYEAAVALAQEELADTRLHAPFTGVVSERLIDSGNYVQVGQHLATIYQVDPMEMSFRLPERHLGRVTAGQRVEVVIASHPDRRFTGEVTFISPAVNDQSRDFHVKAQIDNSDRVLNPGSFGAAVVIVAEHASRPVVPEEAIIPTRSGHVVFVIDDENRARMQSISIGLRTNGMVEVTDGLDGDETIVRTGQLRLNDGSPVEIVPQN